jgi:hypothetical protein
MQVSEGANPVFSCQSPVSDSISFIRSVLTIPKKKNPVFKKNETVKKNENPVLTKIR